MDQDKIGQLISKLRKKKCLTQEQLGQKLGVSSKAVSKWECGLTTPDISIVNDLAEILGITTTELLKGKEFLNKKRIKDSINNLKKVFFKNKIFSTIIIIFIIVFIMMLLFFVNNFNKYEVITFEIDKESQVKSNVFADGYIYISPNKNYIALKRVVFSPSNDVLMIKNLSITIENDDSILLNYNFEETFDDNGKVKPFYANDFLETFSHISVEGKKQDRLKLKNLKLILTYTPENKEKSISEEYNLNFHTDSASRYFLSY